MCYGSQNNHCCSRSVLFGDLIDPSPGLWAWLFLQAQGTGATPLDSRDQHAVLLQVSTTSKIGWVTSEQHQTKSGFIFEQGNLY